MTTKAISATESATCTDEALCCPPEDTQAAELLKAPVDGPAGDGNSLFGPESGAALATVVGGAD